MQTTLAGDFMMVVLDTNHFTEWVNEGASGARLQERCATHKAIVFTTIVTSQESAEGWFALIKRHPAGPMQVPGYRLYQRSCSILSEMGTLAFDEDAAEIVEALKASRVRIGSMDLKIAAICLAHDALLLTRNLRDFAQVPELKVENWLD